MGLSYQYNAEGYFAGEVEDYGLLPNNATHIKAPSKEGYIARWTGKKWELVENHIGEEGYLDGTPHIIREYGALPKGWKTTAPEPSHEEQIKTEIADLKAKLVENDIKRGRISSELLELFLLPSEEKTNLSLEQEYSTLKKLNTEAEELRTQLHLLEFGYEKVE